jgi:hypothetical protein
MVIHHGLDPWINCSWYCHLRQFVPEGLTTWLGYQLTGQGLYGERLFAGLTLIYSGIGHLLLARFTSLDSLSKRPYITSLISWGAGIFYIIRHFIR